MLKRTIAPYEIRLHRRLPPIEKPKIDYLKDKYRHAVWDVFEVFADKCHSKFNADEEEKLQNIIFDELYSIDGRACLINIDAFENWFVNFLCKGLSKFVKDVNEWDMKKAVCGGRIYRARIFDEYGKKYFPFFVDRLLKMKIKNPQKIITISINDTENWHLEFQEEEGDYLRDLIYRMQDYAKIYEFAELDEFDLAVGLNCEL
jgi:hypothetical protein